MEIHYLFVPIEPTPIINDYPENVNFKHLPVYEKMQLSLLEYELTLMYGKTFVQHNYNF
jgi:hypothetical protein